MPAELPDIPWIRRHVFDVPHYTPAGSPVGVNALDIRNAHLIAHQGSPAIRAQYGAPMPSHRHEDPAHPAPETWNAVDAAAARPPGLLPGLNKHAWEIAHSVEQQVRDITTGGMSDAELEADPTGLNVWCTAAYSLAYVAASHDPSLTSHEVWEITEEMLGHLTIVQGCGDPACAAQACPEHPAHNGADHTYEQHHDPSDHAGGGVCRCDVYTGEPDPGTAGVACILNGADGENPDDCTTHGHEQPRRQEPLLTPWQQEILDYAREKMGHPLTVEQVAELIGGRHRACTVPGCNPGCFTDMADIRKIIAHWRTEEEDEAE